MKVFLNKKEMIIEDGCTLGEFLKSQEYISGSYAIALNKNFIARNNYDETILNNQDHIAIIRPMQGG